MKKQLQTFFSFLLILLWPICSHTQTFPLGKKCTNLLEESNDLLNSEAYVEALAILDEFCGNCKTKQAKELGAINKAEAYIALGEFERALLEADVALEVTNDKSLGGHFQKGIALRKLGDLKGSEAAIQKVIELTEMNENNKERAGNYAFMAKIYNRQLKERDSAMMYLDKAITLDPENTAYTILKGDIYLLNQEYTRAYDEYDKALKNGHNALQVYKCKSMAGLKWVEDKYGSNTAQELRDKMTKEDKRKVCADIQKAIDLGCKDVSIGMFSTLVCN